MVLVTYRTEEQELLHDVLELCKKYDVMAFHSTDSRKDIGRGFPDLVLCGRKQVLFAELKSQNGTLGPHQADWKYRLLSVSHYMLWRPEDLSSGRIEATMENL